MAKKNKKKSSDSGGIKKAIKALSSGGITKTEFKSIAKSTGATSQQIVKRMDTLNKAGKDVRLNSGAANAIYKELQKQNPYDLYNNLQAFGTGNIAEAIRGMVGTPGSAVRRNPNRGMNLGIKAGTPGTGLMIGGTQIRPGGRVAVRKPAPAPAPIPAPRTRPTDAERAARVAEAETYGSEIPGSPTFTGLPEPSPMDTGISMPDMGGYQDISSDYQSLDPLQLAALGRAYTSDMIRARRRDNRRNRAAYRRDRNFGMMISPNQMSGNLSFGGGVTI